MLATSCKPEVDSQSFESGSSITRFGIEVHSKNQNVREEAARRLLPYFQNQLIGLVRRRLDARIIRRAGLDDIIQEIWLDFMRAEPGRDWTPSNRSELWNQLLRFATCHVANVAVYHSARKRDFRKEIQPTNDFRESACSASRGEQIEDSREPSVEATLTARDWIDKIQNLLPENLREVFTLRCEGYSNAEIASRIDRVERTVELRIKVIRAILRPILDRIS